MSTISEMSRVVVLEESPAPKAATKVMSSSEVAEERRALSGLPKIGVFFERIAPTPHEQDITVQTQELNGQFNLHEALALSGLK